MAETLSAAETLDDYILRHTTPEHPYLHRLYRATHTQLLRPAWRAAICKGSCCGCFVG